MTDQRRKKPGQRARRSVPLFLAIALMIATLGVFAQEAPANPPAPARAKNIVYVESNDPNGNAIFAFSRANDGKLTPLPGSPFPTGGTGVTPTFALGPFDSDQEVIVNPQGTMLFAVNGGSDTIAVFWINHDGSLTPVDGSPFPSGGSNPVSVGLTGQILCVVNQDQDPDHPGNELPNYTSFQVTPRGALVPVPRSTYFVDAGASPSQALTDGNLLFGADFLGGILRSFQIDLFGQLIASDAQTLPPAVFGDTGDPPFPLGLAVNPAKNILYVGFVTINEIGVYRYSNQGRLRFQRTVPDSGHGVCWLRINDEATRLYASNTGDPSITVYDISRDPTSPVEIQKVTIASTGGGFQIGLDSGNQFLYLVTQQSAPTSTVTSNALHVFKVANDGTLTEALSSPTILPVPNLVRPQGIAAL